MDGWVIAGVGLVFLAVVFFVCLVLDYLWRHSDWQ